MSDLAYSPILVVASSSAVLQCAMVLVVTTSNQYHTGLLTPDRPGQGPASCEGKTGGKPVPPVGKASTGGDCTACPACGGTGGGGEGREGGQRPAASVAAFFLRPTSDHRLLIHCSVT